MSNIQGLSGGADSATEFKGKGKAAPEDDVMNDAQDGAEDDDDDDEEEEEEHDDDDDEEEDDDLKQQGITLENVLGRRTRGVVIDYAKAAAENPVDEEDEEEDEDFEEPDDMEED